jgi:phosphoglycerate kinase
LESFLNKNIESRPSSIIIGGALSYTFLTAQGFDLGQSIIEKNKIDFAQNFLHQAEKQNIKILLPTDHVTLFGIYKNENFNKNESAIDIGPETIKLFIAEIKKAKTIFVNGTMGIYTNKQSELGTKEILNSIANNSNAYKIAGGGDCIAAIHMFKLQKKFDFLSTGGGATLDYLATNKDISELPGLKNL